MLHVFVYMVIAFVVCCFVDLRAPDVMGLAVVGVCGLFAIRLLLLLGVFTLCDCVGLRISGVDCYDCWLVLGWV